MTYLTDHLPFASSSSPSSSSHGLPPPRSHLLVTDTLSSPAHFVLYHLMSAAALDKRRVIWVDFRAEGRASLESALKKAGMPIPKSLSVVSPSSLPSSSTSEQATTRPLFDPAGQPTLRPTYDIISTHLRSETEQEGAVVILDGLAELGWMGFEAGSIQRFVRATLGLTRGTNTTLVSILHADQLPLLPSSPSAPWQSPEMDLLSRLTRIANAWWRVSGLSSGRSGNVSGEISSHNLVPLLAGVAQSDKQGMGPEVPRSKPLQYRLESNTVKLFAKGTGRGYL